MKTATGCFVEARNVARETGDVYLVNYNSNVTHCSDFTVKSDKDPSSFKPSSRAKTVLTFRFLGVYRQCYFSYGFSVSISISVSYFA